MDVAWLCGVDHACREWDGVSRSLRWLSAAGVRLHWLSRGATGARAATSTTVPFVQDVTGGGGGGGGGGAEPEAAGAAGAGLDGPPSAFVAGGGALAPALDPADLAGPDAGHARGVSALTHGLVAEGVLQRVHELPRRRRVLRWLSFGGGRARRLLAEQLSAPPGIEVLHAADRAVWSDAIELGELLDAAVVLRSWSVSDGRVLAGLIRRVNPTRCRVVAATEPIAAELRSCGQNLVPVDVVPPGVLDRNDLRRVGPAGEIDVLPGREAAWQEGGRCNRAWVRESAGVAGPLTVLDRDATLHVPAGWSVTCAADDTLLCRRDGA